VPLGDMAHTWKCLGPNPINPENNKHHLHFACWRSVASKTHKNRGNPQGHTVSMAGAQKKGASAAPFDL